MTIALTIRSNDTRNYPQDGNEDWGTEATNWAQDVTNAVNDSPSLSQSGSWDAIVGSAANVTAGTASHSTLATALAAVAAGSRILVLDGTYSLDAVQAIASAVTIVGQGEGTVFSGSAALAAGGILQISTSGVTLSNLKIDDGSGTPEYALIVDAGVTRCNVSVKVDGTYSVAMLSNASDCLSIKGDDGIMVGPSGDLCIQVKDNDATALKIGSSADDDMLVIDTTTGAKLIKINTDLNVSGTIDLDSVALNDTDDSNDLTLTWNEDDADDRTLNLKVGAGDRTLELNENFTVSGGFDVTLASEDAASTVTLDNTNFEVESTDAAQRDIKITSAKAGNTTLTLEENLTVSDGFDVTLAAEDAATTVTLDNANFEVENTNATQRSIKITSAKAGNTILTFEENLTVADGNNIVLGAQDADGELTLDNSNFEVENTDGTQRNIKITSAKAGDTVLTLEENLTVADGHNVVLASEDADGTLTLDNANFEVESTAAVQRAFKITSSKAGDTTLTFNENLTVGDGEDITFTAEDNTGSLVLDNANFEVENLNATQRDLKLSVGTDAAAELTIEGTASVINQDVSSDASPTFDGLTSTDPLILAEEAATPADPAAGYKKIYPKNDGKLYTLDSSGNEIEVGSGGGAGGVNYIDDADAEAGTGSWATYADAAGTTPVNGDGAGANITWTQNTTTPLRGTADFKLVKDGANRQGEGVAYDFTIDRADTNKTLWISFDVDATDSAYTAGDLAVYIIKDTGGTPTLVTPAYTSIAAATYQFKTSFNADSNTDYRLCIHVAGTTATAWTGIHFDNFKVGPEELIQTTPIEDSITTTLSNSHFINDSGLTISGNLTHKRIGSDLFINGVAYFVGTGTDASILYLDLSTLTGLDSVTITSGSYSPANSRTDNNTATSRYPIQLNIVGDGSSQVSFTDTLGTGFGSTGTYIDYVSISVMLPVNEWAGSSTGMSNSRVEYASVAGTWNADSTTTVNGPGGSLMGGALTASRKKTITWLTPIQPTDTFQVQVSVDRNTWHDINASIIGASYTTPVQQMVTAAGSSLNGSGCYLNAGGTTTSIITFALYASMANDDAPAVNWPSDTYWRVLKCSNPLSIGMPQTVKWKKVEMVTNFTGGAYIDDTTDNSAFKFTLDAGKTYRIFFNVNYTDTNSTDRDARYYIVDGLTVIASFGSGWQDTYTSSGSLFVSTIRAVTDGAIRFRQHESTASVTTIAAGTFAIAEELPYHTEYAGW